MGYSATSDPGLRPITNARHFLNASGPPSQISSFLCASIDPLNLAKQRTAHFFDGKLTAGELPAAQEYLIEYYCESDAING